MQTLAEEHSLPYSRINYPYISTIYPPLAQAAFAVAHGLDPFGLTGWRLVLLASDLIALGLLLKLLKAFRRPPVWASVYWWNPVIVLHGFGAAHMDLLLTPFLLASLLLAHAKRPQLASLALAGGVAVKIWPILLFPFLLRPFLNQPLKMIRLSLIFGLTVLVLLFPQLLHAINPEAGLNAYASEWRTHAFLFAILEDIVFAPIEAAGQAARLTVAGLVIALIGVLALRFGDQSERLPSLFAIVISALILLSPTGYPWYLIWLAPLLPFLPLTGLGALFALAPLYWLRFQLGDDALIYQWVIVPIAFAVPLALITRDFLNWRTHDAIGHHHPSLE